MRNISMIELTIPAMSCGHCKGTITKALLALDATATLQFDIPAHTVRVASVQPVDKLKDALGQAGYPVVSVNETFAAE